MVAVLSRRGALCLVGLCAIATFLLSGCSTSPPFRVLERYDPLLLAGDQIQLYLTQQTEAHLTWLRGYRVPPLLPFSASHVLQIDVTVGTSRNWRVFGEPSGSELQGGFPEYLKITEATWELSVLNSDESIDVIVPLTSEVLMRRTGCYPTGCDYAFEASHENVDLFSFHLGQDDLPEIPRGLLRPLTTVWVAASLSFKVTAVSELRGDRPISGTPYASFEMTSGMSRIWVSEADELVGQSSRMEGVSWVEGL